MSEKQIQLPATLDFFAAQELKEKMLAALAERQGVTLAGTDVERVSTPGLQILVSAARTFKRRNVPMRVIDMSDALVIACDDLAVTQFINDVR